ncbi:hypothetical protein ACI2OX_04950 [Bacillus sp. N9]
MLIQNESKLQSLPQLDNQQLVKEGGTYNVNIKERLPNNEAVIQIKGQELTVKVDGRIPDGEKQRCK